jgi:hypothetical protein
MADSPFRTNLNANQSCFLRNWNDLISFFYGKLRAGVVAVLFFHFIDLENMGAKRDIKRAKAGCRKPKRTMAGPA